MSHCIEKEDIVLVPQGQKYATWHGLETVVEEDITKEVVDEAGLHFPMLETKLAAVTLDGEQFEFEGWKAIVADCRQREDIEDDMIPLNVPRDSYAIIENGRVWNAMQKALEGIPHTVSCVGTLGGLKRYFISIELEGSSRMTVNGDEFHSHLNFITSHDGTLAFEAYDSMIRIVCQNTLDWSRSAAANVGFKVHHKKGADLRVDGVGELINEILKGRQEFISCMEEFDGVELTREEMRNKIGGYFMLNLISTQVNEVDPKEFKFSTRTLNAIENIVELAHTGQGNKGKTQYDLLNGATEYYTSGDGVGKTTTNGKKVYSAQFGTAQKHKNGILSYLHYGTDELLESKVAQVYAELEKND